MKEVGRSTIQSADGTVVNLESEPGGHSIELNYYSPQSKFNTSTFLAKVWTTSRFRWMIWTKLWKKLQKAGYLPVLEMKGTTSRWVYIQDPNGMYIELFA